MHLPRHASRNSDWPANRMLRLGQRRRDVASHAFRELGNLFVGGLVVAQFLSASALSTPRLLAGAALWVVFVTAAIACTKEEAND
jgi:hypothetical protein